ncbi:MAG TPA: dihydroorotase [Spirochaetota bacterium]|mgnify:CR=1 FL=1|nr:dihydroorotase [Spirochaetota bacterium]
MEESKNRIAIVNGNIFIKKRFVKGTIFIENKKIKKVIIGEKIETEKLKKYKVIDASDSFVSYGFFDPHVHFRTPGHTYKEDWKSGSRAALNGGFTYVMDMPNNTPSATTYETLKEKNSIAKRDSLVNYGFYIGLSDKNAYELKDIIKKCRKNKINVLGIKVYIGSSTGDLLIKDFRFVRPALEIGEYVLFHCEDERTLQKFKNIKYIDVSSHNLKRPPLAEIEGLRKIIHSAISIKEKAKIYICHVSSKEFLKEILKFKKKGFNIITEITPHHLFLFLSGIDKSNIYKVNPPIRTLQDVEFLREAFNKGNFNIIGTDHAPHLLKEKFSDNSPSGFPGLESAFYVLMDLYKRRLIDLEMIFKLLTRGYKIFNIPKRGSIKKGNFADIVIIKEKEFIFEAKNCYTKADFSPFEGLKSDYTVDTVIVNGRILKENGKILE